jgi:hypothetical protein
VQRGCGSTLTDFLNRTRERLTVLILAENHNTAPLHFHCDGVTDDVGQAILPLGEFLCMKLCKSKFRPKLQPPSFCTGPLTYIFKESEELEN